LRTGWLTTAALEPLHEQDVGARDQPRDDEDQHRRQQPGTAPSAAGAKRSSTSSSQADERSPQGRV
jgi:hypothetical protein